MKLRYSMLAAACAAMLAGPAATQAVFTELDGQEILFDHVEGVVTCQGGAMPTGDFYMPCGPGVRGHIRNRTVLAYELTGNAVFDGIATINVNVNFDENGEGPMWGTFVGTLFAGGTIEGSYTGKTNVTGIVLDLKGVGHGVSGPVEGLQYMFEVQHTGSPFGEFAARVLNPGGNR